MAVPALALLAAAGPIIGSLSGTFERCADGVSDCYKSFGRGAESIMKAVASRIERPPPSL